MVSVKSLTAVIRAASVRLRFRWSIRTLAFWSTSAAAALESQTVQYGSELRQQGRKDNDQYSHSYNHLQKGQSLFVVCRIAYCVLRISFHAVRITLQAQRTCPSFSVSVLHFRHLSAHSICYSRYLRHKTQEQLRKFWVIGL